MFTSSQLSPNNYFFPFDLFKLGAKRGSYVVFD